MPFLSASSKCTNRAAQEMGAGETPSVPEPSWRDPAAKRVPGSCAVTPGLAQRGRAGAGGVESRGFPQTGAGAARLRPNSPWVARARAEPGCASAGFALQHPLCLRGGCCSALLRRDGFFQLCSCLCFVFRRQEL